MFRIFLLSSLVLANALPAQPEPEGPKPPTNEVAPPKPQPTPPKPEAAKPEPPTSVPEISESFLRVLRPVIGAGFSMGVDDYVDFKTENDALLTKNDSRLRATALAGFFVPLGEHARHDDTNDVCPVNRRMLGRCGGFVFSLQFTQGGRSSVDGFLLGYGFAVRRGILFTAGYSLQKKEELSAGFKRAAVEAIRQNRGEQPFQRYFPLIKSDGTSLVDEEAWDGLPLKAPVPALSFSA